MNKCARCDQTVYPVEGLRCLDKIWHKGCFKCQECNMTLSLKNYKGFDKKPYCNAHCPQAKATTVADTPEIRRLAENTRIQSQAKYHEDFEKSKGKGFTAIADDPETLRIKNTSKIISNVAYHGELERKKQMEERRAIPGPEAHPVPHSNNNNNNNSSHNNNNYQNGKTSGQIRAQYNKVPPMLQEMDYSMQHPNQAQMVQIKHQQHQQKLQNAQDHNGPILTNRHSIDGSMQQPKPMSKHMPAQQMYPINHQQLIMRQQQQQQQQQQHHHMVMQHQQNRHSMDPSLPMMSRQQAKQPIIHSNNNHPQQMIKQPHIMPIQQPASGHQVPPVHINSGQQQHLMNGQRIPPQSSSANMIVGPGVNIHPHHLHQMQHQGFSPQHQQIQGQMNELMPKQQLQFVAPQQQQQRQIIQSQQIAGHHAQMRPMNQQQQPMQPPHPQPMPRRMFRAMYDYAAMDVDEVSFYENDILVDCVNVDGNWLIGMVARSGQTGMLPANYVAEVVPGQ